MTPGIVQNAAEIYLEEVLSFDQAFDELSLPKAKKVGISEVGLQRIIKTNSTKVETIENISRVLDVPISTFFGNNSLLLVEMSDFLHSPLVKMNINRYEKISDKLSLMKDYYVWEVMWKTFNNQVVSYPFNFPDSPQSLLNNESDVALFSSFYDTLLETPYSKMNEIVKKSLSEREYLFDGFYFTIFIRNEFNINDYLSDGLIKDNDMLKYWKAWKEIKSEIQGLNWKI